MILDKWRFNTCQDWEILRDDFDSVSSDTIRDNTLQALDFHFSPLSHLEEGALQFVNVTDVSDFMIELLDNGQPITDSKNEKVKKQNKLTAKKKK